MNQTPKYFLFSIFIMITSCDLGFPTEWELEFSQQSVENSNLKIISYTAWGGLDTRISDKKIMLDSDRFNDIYVGKGDNFSLLGNIPDVDTIEIIEFDRSRKVKDSNLPIDIKYEKLKHTTIKRYVYSYGGAVLGPCTYKSVIFDEVIESADSIHFSNCISTFAKKVSFGNLSFPKGNVYIDTGKDSSEINKIRIELLLLRETEPLICVQSWSLQSTKEISLKDFSKRGIFR